MKYIMRKRLLSIIIVASVMGASCSMVYACDKKQTEEVVLQLLFGDGSFSKKESEEAQILLDALFLCSEQYGKSGIQELEEIKEYKIPWLPTFNEITINNEDDLLECSHTSWKSTYPDNSKIKDKRKSVLQKTVNEVFDFGFFDHWFKSNDGKCDSFSALLYYSHILADYLTDDPFQTETYVGDYIVPPYKGNGSIDINGGKPLFTETEMQNMAFEEVPIGRDELNRCQAVFKVVNYEDIHHVRIGPERNGLPKPVGYRQIPYPDMVKGENLYNRCHVIARRFNAGDNLNNLVTGTRYLNETMLIYEDKVANYLEKNKTNHVLYRVTPIYKGDNLLPSGMQMEACSIEEPEELSFNVYCYNVQPGIKINYENGNSEVDDELYSPNSNDNKAIPFAINNPTDDKPDLIYEIDKCLRTLLEDQEEKYISIFDEIKPVINEARTVGEQVETSHHAKDYIKLKELELKYWDFLEDKVPELLENEKFFHAVFG